MNLTDLFTVASLTAAINKLPLIPTHLGESGLFVEKGVTTTVVVIEEQNGRLVLVPNSSRDGDGFSMTEKKRKRRTFSTFHLSLTDQLEPGALQNIAPFGQQTNVLQQQAAVINNKLQTLKNSIDATREWQRIGAISGQIRDADGSVVYDLFDEFGITKKAIKLKTSDPATEVRSVCLGAKRYAEAVLGGAMVRGFRAYCDAEFFDALTNHDSVKEAFAHYQEAADRLGGDMRGGFTFGGIEFIEYSASISGQPFIPAKKAKVFPVGVGIYEMYNAPANYNETVNTLGQPFYSKAEPRRMGKGWDIEAQSNPLAICHYPEALVELELE